MSDHSFESREGDVAVLIRTSSGGGVFFFRSSARALLHVIPRLAFLQLVFSLLPLIRLIQQNPIGSVSGCLGRRFPGCCANFKPISLPKKLAGSISPPVVGLMALSVRDADTGRPTNLSFAKIASALATKRNK